MLGSKRLQELSRRHVEKAWKQLLQSGHHLPGKGLAVKTVKNIHGCFSDAMKWALDEELIATLPTYRATKFLKTTKPKADAHTPDECAELIRALEGHWLQPIVIVAMQTGLRLGEILALHWRHVDLEAKTLAIDSALTSTDELGTFVKDTKTEAGERVIALSPFTCDTLRKAQLNQAERNLRLQARSNDMPIFDSWPVTGKAGEYFMTWQVSNAYGRVTTRLLRQEKISRKLRFHDLRHTHLSLLLLDGAPVTTVAQRAGHKTAHTTMTTYAHAIAGSDRDLMAGLNEDYLRNAASP